MAALQAAHRLWKLPVQVGVVRSPRGHPKGAVPRVVHRLLKLPVQVVALLLAAHRQVALRQVAVAHCST